MVNTLKVGGELRIKELSLRAGYFNRSKMQNSSSLNDHAVTLGVGFDFGPSSLNFSLVNYTQIQEFQLFSECLTDSFELSKNSPKSL